MSHKKHNYTEKALDYIVIILSSIILCIYVCAFLKSQYKDFTKYTLLNLAWLSLNNEKNIFPSN